jgi:hypothetical protein
VPFKSEAQRRCMWARHPEMARRWQKETPRGELPEKVKKGAIAGKLQRKAGILAYKKVTGQLPHVPTVKEKKASLAAFFDELEKISAMGVDLRLLGPGGIRRPPFPTEGSKQVALSKFKESKKPGNIGVRKPPDPSIRSVATMPQY